MTGAGIMVQDITRNIIDTNNAKTLPGQSLKIIAMVADYRVLCLGELCGFKLCPSAKKEQK